MKWMLRFYSLYFSIISLSVFNLNMNLLLTGYQQKKSCQNYDKWSIENLKKTRPIVPKKETQMSKLANKTSVRVAIDGDYAYWVDNNVVFKAIIDDFGGIEVKNAKIIDVFSLSEKETEQLFKILDTISSI
jgi:hypothetical protein